jgi:hypothetical protein
MCDRIAELPLGNPAIETWKSTVAFVIAPLLSLVVLKVMTAVPDAFASAPETAGTSFDALSGTVKIVGWVEGLEGLLLPHPKLPIVAATVASTSARFMGSLLLVDPGGVPGPGPPSTLRRDRRRLKRLHTAPCKCWLALRSTRPFT